VSSELSETDGFLPLSGLQHVVFCERQAALIHIERVWQENTATALGRIVHERADQPGRDHRRGVRVVRAMPLHSTKLRVVGVADTVEYHRTGPRSQAEIPFPVEYKRGRVRSQVADQVQLCAQAMCLEELHGIEISEGALFYDASHRRVAVSFTKALRNQTEAAAARMHELVAKRMVPPAEPGPRCKACSLEPICMPELTARRDRVTSYLAQLIAEARPL
jgi:CRISPR-associated exonuclease Cas4